jgi:hypothetical protein
MPIHYRENQYQGINAHLQSALQSPGGGWESFHAAHITNLTEAIDALLPAGYYVLNKKSLQLSTFNLLTDEQRYSRTRPDLGIYRDQPTSDSPTPASASTPALTLPIVKTVLEEDPLPGVVIYKAEATGDEIPVTRIELLSPGNKPGGAHYPQYISKRNATLDSGINLIEIDYLHETRSPAWGLASYPDHEAGAYPYTILVSNPHPSVAEGQMAVYGFHVDQPLKPITVPLAGPDTITVDFGAVYNTTFTRNRYYGTRVVDYEQLPVRFETYTPADQQRIKDRMDTIRQQKDTQTLSQTD